MENALLFAQNKIKNCDPASNDNKCFSILPEVSGNPDQVRNGLGIFFGIIAAVAVLVIIIAAINFATSEGNPDNISRSKKTIIYALVGLVIALLAEAAVFTLLGRL